MADETTTRAPSSPIDFSAPVTTNASAPDTADAGAPNAAGGAACAKCATPLTGYYYESAGTVYCPKCKHAAEAAAGGAGGQGGGMGRAALFGFGAAIVGAIGYWAFIKITDWDWALVSIAVGMLVATAIRKGNGNHGGRRYQYLAVALTYIAIGGAYAPFAIQGVMEGMNKGESRHATAPVAGAAASTSAGASAASPAEPAAEGAVSEAANAVASDVAAAPAARTDAAVGRLASGEKSQKMSAAKAVVMLLLIAVLVVVATPIVIIAGGFPGSIINIIIVGFALRRAWQMTGAGVGVTTPTFSGPYNVRSRPAVAATGG